MSGISGKQIRDDSLTGEDVHEETLDLPSFLAYGKNSALTDQIVPTPGAFQLVTTNGSQNGQGWRMPLGGHATHLSVQFDSTSYGGNSRTLTVELYINGTGTGETLDVIVNGNGDFGAHGEVNSQNAGFGPGDKLALYLFHDNTGITTSNIAALIRVVTMEQHPQ